MVGFGLSSAVSDGASQIPERAAAECFRDGSARRLGRARLAGVAHAFPDLVAHVRRRFSAGLSVVVAAFLLIPWPCSYTFAAFMNFRSLRTLNRVR